MQAVSVVRWLLTLITVVLAVVVASLIYVRVTGLRAAAEPGPIERRLAQAARRLAIPSTERNRPNPLPPSAEAIAAGLAHFADHCASCHGNDGSGNTDLGRGLYPPPPDMRQDPTQRLSDGELFYVIEHGIRFTGMPAFGSGDPEHAEQSWQLVHFIRSLPALTAADVERMREMNPRPPAEIRQEIEEERFLRGES
jgi:mono/diheme cytochrome c family protein